MPKLISGGITEFFSRSNWIKVKDKYEYVGYELSSELSEDKDRTNHTYLCICGPTQADWLEKIPEILAKNGGKIIYQSPKALNFEHSTAAPRNTLVLFEFD